MSGEGHSVEQCIAIVTDYNGLMTALRARAAALDVSRETLDGVTGLQNGYSAKLLAPVPLRSLGPVSLGPMLQALGLAIVLVEDPAALRRFGGQLSRRKRAVRSDGTDGVITKRITLRKLSFLGRRGGKKRAENMTAKQRSRSARKAARARWEKRRAFRRNGRLQEN